MKIRSCQEVRRSCGDGTEAWVEDRGMLQKLCGFSNGEEKYQYGSVLAKHGEHES